MSVHAEPISWPEAFEEAEDNHTRDEARRIVHVRHRVGEYEVTRLVLESRDESEAAVK
jgi:hypothetical protein